MPVIPEHTMKYKKALRLFQKYKVQMEVTGWNEKAFHMVHTFIVGHRLVAKGTSQGVIIGKKGVVSPEEVMQKVGQNFKERGESK